MAPMRVFVVRGILFSELCFGLETGLGIENLLAETDGLGSYLDKLVGSDELQSLLKSHLAWRSQNELLVRTGGTNGGQMLFLADVDNDISHLGVLAHDHTLVYVSARGNEHIASVLNGVQSVRCSNALFISDERSGITGADLSLEGNVVLKNAVHDTFTVGVGQTDLVVTKIGGTRSMAVCNIGSDSVVCIVKKEKLGEFEKKYGRMDVRYNYYSNFGTKDVVWIHFIHNEKKALVAIEANEAFYSELRKYFSSGEI